MEEALALLRSQRNQKLADCDWTQLDDCALDPNKQQEWVTYRQLLRDLPASTTDPANPIWPTQP